jgi:hypothetical protein
MSSVSDDEDDDDDDEVDLYRQSKLNGGGEEATSALAQTVLLYQGVAILPIDDAGSREEFVLTVVEEVLEKNREVRRRP